MPDPIAATEFELWDGRRVETWSVAVHAPAGSDLDWSCTFEMRRGDELVEAMSAPGVDGMQALVGALAIVAARIRDLRVAGGQISWYGRNDGYICFDELHTADPSWTGQFDYLPRWRSVAREL
jgi:hypothetical protein